MAGNNSSQFAAMKTKVNSIRSDLYYILDNFNKSYSLNGKGLCYNEFKCCIEYLTIAIDLCGNGINGNENNINVNSRISTAEQTFSSYDNNAGYNLCINEGMFNIGVNRLYQAQSSLKTWASLLDTYMNDSNYFGLKTVYQTLYSKFNEIISKVESVKNNLMTESSEIGNVSFSAADIKLIEEVSAMYNEADAILKNVSAEDAYTYLKNKNLSSEKIIEILTFKCNTESTKLKLMDVSDKSLYLQQKNEMLKWGKVYYSFLSENNNLTQGEKTNINNLISDLDSLILYNERYIETEKITQKYKDRLSTLEEGSYDYCKTLYDIVDELIKYYENIDDRTVYDEERLDSLKIEIRHYTYLVESKSLYEQLENNTIEIKDYFFKLYWSCMWNESTYYYLLKKGYDNTSSEYKTLDDISKSLDQKMIMYYDLYEAYAIFTSEYTRDYSKFKALKTIFRYKKIILEKEDKKLSPEEERFLSDDYKYTDYISDQSKVWLNSIISGIFDKFENILDVLAFWSAGYSMSSGSLYIPNATPTGHEFDFMNMDLSAEYYEKQVGHIIDYLVYGEVHSKAYAAGTFLGSIILSLISKGSGLINALSYAGDTYENVYNSGVSMGNALLAATVNGSLGYAVGSVVNSNINYLVNPNNVITPGVFAWKTVVSSAVAGLSVPAGSFFEYVAIGDFDVSFWDYASENNVLEVALMTGASAGFTTVVHGLFGNPNSSLYSKRLHDELGVENFENINGDGDLNALPSQDLINVSSEATHRGLVSTASDAALKMQAMLVLGIGGTSYCVSYGGMYPSEPSKFLDGILSLSDSINAGLDVAANYIKEYNVSYAEYLPRADAYLSDEFIVDYYKTLFPSNDKISNVSNISELAYVLSRGITETFITLQCDNPVRGNVDTSRSVSVSWLKANEEKYSDCYKFENGKLVILDYVKFGQKVLGGVALSATDGAYMIETSVPLNSETIGVPSILNGTADILGILPFYCMPNTEDVTAVINPFAAISDFDITGMVGTDSNTKIKYSVTKLNGGVN